MPRPVCVSLFSGAMGLDIGLEQAGFDVKFCADSALAAIGTIRANRPDVHVFEGDVRALTADEVREAAKLAGRDIDLLAGGPPCQSFSTAGRRKSLDCERHGPPLLEYVRLLGELRPKAFLIENVKGLLSASLTWRPLPYNNNGKRIDEHFGALLRDLLCRIRKLGYSIDFREINAADFGVPQQRVRVVLIGYRDGYKPVFPRPTHTEVAGLFTSKWVTVREAFKGLENDTSFIAKFSPRKARYLEQIPEGGNWRDLPTELQRESMGRAFHAKGGRSGYWRRLSFDRPAPTILTEPQNASTSLCHPLETRPVSVRECARLQSFPDDWQFCGRGAEQYRLIGNAVPPRLGYAIGQTIRETLEERSLAATG